MSDLISMIDDTTERLLKKIDNWEVPQSDKKYVTIEKEVWESTLRQSMEKIVKLERLEGQLEKSLKLFKQIAKLTDEYPVLKVNELAHKGIEGLSK